MSWKVRWGGRGWPSFIVPATFCQDSWFKRQTDFSQRRFANLASRLQTCVIIYVAWSMRACYISASVKECWRRCTNCTMLFASCILPARWEIDNICTRPLYICTAYIYLLSPHISASLWVCALGRLIWPGELYDALDLWYIWVFWFF